MRNHRVDTQKVAENVKLEVVYESNPYFAGESVQVLIRLRHLGSLQTHEQLDLSLQALKQQQEDQEKETANGKRKSWTVQSLWGSINSEKKALSEKNQATIARVEKDLQFHSPVRLASCYAQIYGSFQYDPEAINSRGFEQQAHHRLAGVGSLKLSEGKNSIAESFAGLLFSNLEDVARESVAEPTTELVKVPFFLIPQTLVFSETILEPGQTRTYHFKSPRLPQDLAPSYQTSKQLKIQYFLNFGLTEIKANQVVPFNADYNIHICPFIDVHGRQQTSKLDNDIFIAAPGRVKEIKESVQSRRKSSPSILMRRKSSLISINTPESKQEANLECKALFKQLMSDQDSSAKLANDIEGLVDQVMECQFGTDNTETSEEDEGETTLDQSQLSVRKESVSVRNNLTTLFRNLTKASSTTEDVDNSDTPETVDFISQVKKLQREYIINRDGVFVAKVTLSNLFYTTSDDIDLTIQLGVDEPHKVSAVTTSLKSFELINPKYCTEITSGSSRRQGNTFDESRAICFEDTSTIHTKLLPQRSPTKQMTSQFKSDIFQFKWMLCLKFVLINRAEMPELMQKYYEDKNGSLLHAKQSLDGEEFVCHLPLTILPTAKNFAGW
ncbi:LAME_0G07800g1_1 [Lachancea meyersii CBS 8951]|uniref:LAME_0G07800g1_1 n=1 Tax=Lachancea meyersii CBS 8951 TaxID=1266667 RepID=A0A1G4K889_9SACH|nr:LAME_0G07800g1_1 [Lachancea meyersii CBS 8951]